MRSLDKAAVQAVIGASSKSNKTHVCPAAAQPDEYLALRKTKVIVVPHPALNTLCFPTNNIRNEDAIHQYIIIPACGISR
jgi:hypothetical protein